MTNKKRDIEAEIRLNVLAHNNMVNVIRACIQPHAMNRFIIEEELRVRTEQAQRRSDSNRDQDPEEI